MVFQSDLNTFDFPIDLNDQWTLANTVDFYIQGYVNVNGAQVSSIDEKSLDNPVSDDLLAISKEFISVRAGYFETYKITGEVGNPSEMWYSPEVGYIIRLKQHIPKFLLMYDLVKIDFNCNLELWSSNFYYPEQ